MAQTQKKVKYASNPNRGGSKKKGGSSMAKKNGKKNSKKSNPIGMHRKRRRNPDGVAAIIGSPKDMLITGVAGLVSAVATRQLPQLILNAGNTGIEGYAANLATALLATWAAGALAGPKAAWGAVTGGLVILLDRVLTEQVSPIGPYLALSGVGDATAMGKMGTIREGYYAHPGLVDGNGNLITPAPFTNAAVAAVMANPQIAAAVNNMMANGGGAGGGGKMGAVQPSALRRHTASGALMSSRYQGRFNQAQN